MFVSTFGVEVYKFTLGGNLLKFSSLVKFGLKLVVFGEICAIIGCRLRAKILLLLV